jgi:hypothetical protein
LAILFWTVSLVLAVVGLLVSLWIAALIELVGLALGASLWNAVSVYVEDRR